jgi:hypothetical protein
MSASSVPVNAYNYNPTDAQLRTFLTAYYAAMESQGWTQSADTGQMNETTVTFAGLNGTYQVHYFNDSLHGTAPCYIKTVWSIYSTSYIALQIIVMASSDGSGGTTTPNVTHTPVSSATSINGLATLHKTYAAGRYSGIFFENPANVGGNSDLYSQFSFFFARTVDLSTGAATGDGWFLYTGYMTNSVTLVAVRDRPANTITDTNSYCMIHGTGTLSAVVSGGRDVWRHWFIANSKYQMNPYMGTVDKSAVRTNGTFSATVLPAYGAHTYRRVGDIGVVSSINNNSQHVQIAIWE